jgi:hypothetical protein
VASFLALVLAVWPLSHDGTGEAAGSPDDVLLVKLVAPFVAVAACVVVMARTRVPRPEGPDRGPGRVHDRRLRRGARG